MDNNPYFTGLLKASHGNIQVDAIIIHSVACIHLVAVLIYYRIGSLQAETVLHTFLISPGPITEWEQSRH